MGNDRQTEKKQKKLVGIQRGNPDFLLLLFVLFCLWISWFIRFGYCSAENKQQQKKKHMQCFYLSDIIIDGEMRNRHAGHKLRALVWVNKVSGCEEDSVERFSCYWSSCLWKDSLTHCCRGDTIEFRSLKDKGHVAYKRWALLFFSLRRRRMQTALKFDLVCRRIHTSTKAKCTTFTATGNRTRTPASHTRSQFYLEAELAYAEWSCTG